MLAFNLKKKIDRPIIVLSYGDIDFVPRNSFEHLEFMSFHIEAEKIHPISSVGQQYRVQWKTLDICQFSVIQFRL